VPIAWPLPAALRRWLPGFVSVTFAAAIAWDILETAAYLIGWPAAQWLALAFLSWIWHGRGLALCVEALLRPLGWAVPGASAQNPFLHLVHVLTREESLPLRIFLTISPLFVRNLARPPTRLLPFRRVWSNIAMLESLAVSQWRGVACEGDSGFIVYFLPFAMRSIITAVVLNEVASAISAAAAHLDGARSDWPAWLARRLPIVLGYVASLAITGGAVAISACGCGASASFAWWALLVQLASVAAAYITAEAAEGHRTADPQTLSQSEGLVSRHLDGLGSKLDLSGAQHEDDDSSVGAFGSPIGSPGRPSPAMR
jgi:hypothetical protein